MSGSLVIYYLVTMLVYNLVIYVIIDIRLCYFYTIDVLIT